MANQLFSEMTKKTDNNMMSQFDSFKQNPIQFLLQKNINIPQQYMNNPQEAVQYLLNNGTMSQNTFNNLRQMASKMGIKI